MVPPHVLIFGVLAIGVLLLISGCNITTQIYLKAFVSHKLRSYNILFLVIFAIFSKGKTSSILSTQGFLKAQF